MKKKLNVISKNIKKNRKKYIIAGICLLLIIIVCLLIKFFANNTLTIDIASQNVGYMYGPSGETVVKAKVGDVIDLKVITESLKEGMVKCEVTNNQVAKFEDKDTFKATHSGETEIYCELFNTKSNVIKVVIGG